MNTEIFDSVFADIQKDLGTINDFKIDDVHTLGSELKAGEQAKCIAVDTTSHIAVPTKIILTQTPFGIIAVLKVSVLTHCGTKIKYKGVTPPKLEYLYSHDLSEDDVTKIIGFSKAVLADAIETYGEECMEECMTAYSGNIGIFLQSLISDAIVLNKQ